MASAASLPTRHCASRATSGQRIASGSTCKHPLTSVSLTLSDRIPAVEDVGLIAVQTRAPYLSQPGSYRRPPGANRLGVPACVRQEVAQCCGVVRPEDDRRLEVPRRHRPDELATTTARRNDVQSSISRVPPYRDHPVHGWRRGSHELAQGAKLGTDRKVAADTSACKDTSVFRFYSRAHVGHPEPLAKKLWVQGFGCPDDQIGIRQRLSAAIFISILRSGHAPSLPCLTLHDAHGDDRVQGVGCFARPDSAAPPADGAR